MQQIWQLGLKWDTPLPEKLHKPLQKILNNYFESPPLNTLEHSIFLQVHRTLNILHVFVDASTCAIVAIISLGSYDNNTKQTETSFIISKCKATPLKSLSVPKLELEAEIIGIRLLKTVQKETTLKIHDTLFWTDSRVVFDWIVSEKKQKLFIANRIREIHESLKSNQWHYIPTNQNPADHRTRGLEPEELCSKWLEAPDFLKKHYSDWNSADKIVSVPTTSTSKPNEPVIDPIRFPSWRKLLLTLATIYNLLFRIKKDRSNKEQYTADDINQADSHLILISQKKVFNSAIHSLRRGRKLDSKCKIRSLNPYIDKNGILRSESRLQFAPEELQLANLPIILHAKDSITRLYLEHAHRICIHQGTEAVKAFVQQRYVVIGLRKTLLSIRFRRFLSRRFDAQNIQPLMAPLPVCRFPKTPKTSSPSTMASFSHAWSHVPHILSHALI